MTARIEPLASPLSPELQARMDRIFPPELPLPQLYLTVARNEGLFIDMVDRGLIGPTGLMDRRTLPKRLREAVILRTCAAADCAYEWNLHVQTISERMGLSRLEIDDLQTSDLSAETWTPAERAALELVEDLVKGRRVDDAPYAAARAHHDEATLIELTQLVGLYTMVAMLVALGRPAHDRYR